MFVSYDETVYVGQYCLIGEPPNDASNDGVKSLHSYSLLSSKTIAPSYFPVILKSQVIIRDFVSVDLGIKRPTIIGSNSYIHTRASLHHDVQIGDKVVIGPNACICGSVSIKSFAQIGASSVIHQNLLIGSCAMLGMGSVVTRNIPPFVIAYGNPAVVHRINYKKLLYRLCPSEIEHYFTGYIESCRADDIASFLSSKSLPFHLSAPIIDYLDPLR